MEDNKIKAMQICGCDTCARKRQCDLGGTYCEGMEKAMMMADLKDRSIKQFFIEHISPGVEVETNENGEPLAESFIEASKARFAAAEKAYARFKEFEQRF